MIVKVWKIYVSSGIKQVIGGVAHNLRFILDFFNLVIIEAVPIPVVFGIGCIVSTLELAIMVRYTNKVID